MQRVEALLEPLAPTGPGSRSPGRGSACRRRTRRAGRPSGCPRASIHSRARASSSPRIARSSSSAASAVSRISVCANSLRKPATRSPSAHSRPGRRRDDDRERAHQLGDRVGVQRPGAAEGDERELARVVAALDADHAQRARHVLVDDPQDAVGGLPRATAPSRRRPSAPRRARPRRRATSRRRSGRAGRRPSTTLASVTVGSVAALAVGRGPGLGARRLRPDAQRAGQLRDVRDRAAARADRVHVDARDLDAELADRGLAADRRLTRLAQRRRRSTCRPCRT